MRILTIKYSDIARCPFRIMTVDHYNDDGTCRCERATCVHCDRDIVRIENGTWIDPEADGDDIVWAETCDSHDTFQAEHEPTVHLLTTREGNECGTDGPSDPDINAVTCPACLSAHEALTSEDADH